MSATCNSRGIVVRDAAEKDVKAILDIYNHYVRHSVATFDMDEQTLPERQLWYEQHQRDQLPVLVAESKGTVVGWASLSYYHSRCAYKKTVEPSVYVAPSHIRSGIGSRLIQELFARASDLRYHCIVGLVCSENASSLAMMTRHGFELVGVLRQVGRKFDRWLDVTIMQRLVER